MKALTEGKKSNDLILGDIRQHLVLQNKKDSELRDQSHIHPSEMAKDGFCARQVAYRISGVNGEGTKEEFGHRTVMIFSEGHNSHSKIQGWLGDMGRLWGKWACDTCREYRTMTGPTCPICSNEMTYKEVPLEYPVLGEANIKGHADGGIVDLHALIEIKTVGLGTLRIDEPALVKQYTHKVDGKYVVDLDGIWANLKRPLKSHRIQAMVYLALAKEMRLDIDRMIFLYEFKPTQDMKEFVIPYNEEKADELITTAKAITSAARDGNPEQLGRIDNAGRTNKHCKSCPWLERCLGGAEQEAPTEDPDRAVRSEVTGQAGEPRTPRSRRVSGGEPSDDRRQSLRPRRHRVDGADDEPSEVGELRTDATEHRDHRREGTERRPRGNSGQEDGPLGGEDRVGDEGTSERAPRRRRSPRPRV